MTIFFISDTHFGSQGVNEFVHHDGTPLRPFSSYHDADGIMCENWNNVVKPNDTVYHLGDVAFSKFGLQMIGLLNGKKRLIRGNHDHFPTGMYLTVFEEVYGTRQMNGFWLTHAPMHEQCAMEYRVKLNIHGHLHRNLIRPTDEVDVLDGIEEHPKYFNASVEQINFTPISLDEITTKKGI